MTLFDQKISTPFKFDAELPKDALQRVHKNLREHQYAFFNVLNDRSGLDEIQQLAAQWQHQFQHIVVLGTGGSSLGGKTLVSLQDNPFKAPKIIFADNVDPRTLTQLFEAIDLETTGFIVISKSGSTAETLCQFLCICKKYEDAGYPSTRLRQHFLMITEPKENTLRRMGESLGCLMINHDPQIGGRFSVFSNVGLLPAAIAGLNISQIRQGAQAYCSSDLQMVIEASHFHYNTIQKGYQISVMMPYIDRLQSFAAWYCQLWAESLGKDGRGTTPVRALGTVDQHSQLQLYRDGPRDKTFTFIYETSQSLDHHVSQQAGHYDDLAYLQQKAMGDLLLAELHATATSLSNQGCPTRLIALPDLSEKTMGALLAHFMLETILMAELLQINAFDQPGVEESKILTRQYLKERRAS